MRKSKFTEEQIAYALKQAELGIPVEEVCRKMGISSAEFARRCCLHAATAMSKDPEVSTSERS